MFRGIQDFYDALADSKKIGAAGMRAKWEKVPGVKYPEKKETEEEPEEDDDGVPDGYVSMWQAMQILECSGRVLDRYGDAGEIRRVLVPAGRSKVYFYCLDDVEELKKKGDKKWKRG